MSVYSDNVDSLIQYIFEERVADEGWTDHLKERKEYLKWYLSYVFTHSTHWEEVYKALPPNVHHMIKVDDLQDVTVTEAYDFINECVAYRLLKGK